MNEYMNIYTKISPNVISPNENLGHAPGLCGTYRLRRVDRWRGAVRPRRRSRKMRMLQGLQPLSTHWTLSDTLRLSGYRGEIWPNLPKGHSQGCAQGEVQGVLFPPPIAAWSVVKVVLRSRGGGLTWRSHCRLEQTPYGFRTQLIWRYLGIT